MVNNMSTFTGFSEEDLIRIKSSESGAKSVPPGHKEMLQNVRKIDKIGFRPKRTLLQNKSLMLSKHISDEAIDAALNSCKLTLKTQSSVDASANNKEVQNGNTNLENAEENVENNNNSIDSNLGTGVGDVSRKNSTSITPDVVRCVDNYTEDELAAHKVKLEELQLKQKLMEEQNKKRKEMLAKALADRTKQTEEEVMRLEKIKKELQILDGQFSQDVSVLRKKIDQACLSYADAEKHYLKIEKEFLQAKINLQKEKEKKELLTEHLCALITHNETRKAQKLETLMLELATNQKDGVKDVRAISIDEAPVIIDGVDEKTGKMVEISPES